MNDIEVSIIIVNYNSGKYLYKTLKSITEKVRDISYETIVVDNASTDSSLEGVNNFDKTKIVKLEKNVGFARANNLGVKKAKGKYILILNNDTIVFKNNIENLLQIKKEYPEYGLVAPVVLNEDRTFQLSFGKDLNLVSEFFTKFFSRAYYRLSFKLKNKKFFKKVDWVSGVCFLISKELYNKVGGFDENYFIYIEDADFGKRIREKGYKILVTSKAKIIHYKGKSVSKHEALVSPENKRSQLIYYSKHNSHFQFIILKFYLFSKFKIKYYLCFFTGKIHKRNIFKDILNILREFSYEDYS